MRFVVLLAMLTSFVLGCGGYDEFENDLNFLHTRQGFNSDISRDLDSIAVYNDINYKYKENAKKQNLKLWQKELKDLNLTQIESLIYENKGIKELKNEQIKEYLEFLASQEKFVKYYYKWEKKPAIKLKTINTYINTALEKIKKVNSKQLKLRYFFLALRLAHYKKTGNALKIYEKHKALVENQNNILTEWIQGLYAGALVKSGKIEEGVYEFSKLFSPNTTAWHLAFYNFHHIKKAKQLEKLLSLAKNKDEKLKLITLRALKSTASLQHELQAIAKIDPNSRWFDFLLYRRLFKMQFMLNGSGAKMEFDESLFRYLVEAKKDNAYIINLALGYDYFYKKDFKNADVYVKKSLEFAKNKEDKKEAENLEYLLYLNSLKKGFNENEVYDRFIKISKDNFSKKNLRQYTFKTLALIYEKENKPLKKLISQGLGQYTPYFDLDALNVKTYNELMALKSNTNRNKLEEFMLKSIKDQTSEQKIKPYYATMLINDLQFKKALEVNANIYIENNQNIFNATIRGNNRKLNSKYSSNAHEFLSKLVLIKQNLDKNPNLATDNYLYATAIYNLSYFGNMRILAKPYISINYYTDQQGEKKKIEQSNKYYKMALDSTDDKEFKAKIIYQLAKNELASFDIKNSKKYGQDYSFDRMWDWKVIEDYFKNGYGRYFKILKDEYSDTNYYKEVLKECGNFSTYVKNH